MSTEEVLTEEAVTRDLASRLAPKKEPGPAEQLTRRHGIVTAIATGPPPSLTVTIGATSVAGIPYRAWYFPTIGDEVDLDFEGGAPIVNGNRAGGGFRGALGIVAAPALDTGTGTIAAALTSGEQTVKVSNTGNTFAGRRYEITSYGTFGGDTNVAGLRIRIRRGSGTGGAQVEQVQMGGEVFARDRHTFLMVATDVPGTVSGQRYTMTCERTTAAGAYDIHNPTMIMFKDIGRDPP